MGDLLLSTDSVLMCPHGGLVTHVPTTSTTYRVAGRPPMLLGDVYTIAGCPFTTLNEPCIMVQWATASTRLIVKGRPILTNTSVGICQSPSGVPNGPVVIASTQLGLREPDEHTSIND